MTTTRRWVQWFSQHSEISIYGEFLSPVSQMGMSRVSQFTPKFFRWVLMFSRPQSRGTKLLVNTFTFFKLVLASQLASQYQQSYGTRVASSSSTIPSQQLAASSSQQQLVVVGRLLYDNGCGVKQGKKKTGIKDGLSIKLYSCCKFIDWKNGGL